VQNNLTQLISRSGEDEVSVSIYTSDGIPGRDQIPVRGPFVHLVLGACQVLLQP
jgi:hypothetical protein